SSLCCAAAHRRAHPPLRTPRQPSKAALARPMPRGLGAAADPTESATPGVARRVLAARRRSRHRALRALWAGAHAHCGTVARSSPTLAGTTADRCLASLRLHFLSLTAVIGLG